MLDGCSRTAWSLIRSDLVLALGSQDRLHVEKGDGPVAIYGDYGVSEN